MKEGSDRGKFKAYKNFRIDQPAFSYAMDNSFSKCPANKEHVALHETRKNVNYYSLHGAVVAANYNSCGYVVCVRTLILYGGGSTARRCSNPQRESAHDQSKPPGGNLALR